MDAEEREDYLDHHNLASGGSMRVLDAQGREVLGADAVVTIKRGFSRFVRRGGNWELAHEHAHFISSVARRTMTDAQVATMRRLFGDPANANEAWNEENAGNQFAEWLRGKYDFRPLTAEERRAKRGFFRRMLDAVKALFHLTGEEAPAAPVERTQREQAMDAAFESLKNGDFSGLDVYAGIDFAEDAKPSDEAQTAAKEQGQSEGEKARTAERKPPAYTLDDFFTPAGEGDVEIPLAALKTYKKEPEQSVVNALKAMELARQGKGDRRRPVAVADNGDGTYTIVDGNATALGLSNLGVDKVRVRVVGTNKGTRFHNSAYMVEQMLPEGLRVDGVGSLDEAMDRAAANIDALTAIVNAAADKVNGEAVMRSPDKETGLRMKTRASAERKMEDDYDGDASRLVDLIGGTVVMDDDSDLGDAVKAIRGNLPEGAEIVRVKKLNFKPGDVGYQDVKVSVRFANGGIGEIILINRETNDAKFNRGGHAVYELTRVVKPYEGKSAEVDEALTALIKLDGAIYARGDAVPSQADFERIKANASSSVMRLLAQT